MPQIEIIGTVDWPHGPGAVGHAIVRVCRSRGRERDIGVLVALDTVPGSGPGNGRLSPYIHDEIDETTSDEDAAIEAALAKAWDERNDEVAS
jgi:hypothetical protein